MLVMAFVAGLNIKVLAQPVYNSCGNGPVIGTSLVAISHRCDTTGVFEGPSGPNITWDFSGLIDIAYSPYTRPHVDPDSTPGGINYPNSSVAWYESAGYSYFHYQPSSIDYQGNYNGVQVCTIYTDPAITLICPMSYGSSFTDTYETNICGGQPAFGDKTVTYDAFGTLILPYGTFQNAVRFHVIDTFNLPGITLTYDNYSWWDSSLNMEVLIVSYRTGLPTRKYIQFTQVTGVLAASDNQIATPSIMLYPNPVRDQVHIETPDELQGSWLTLFSVSGQIAAMMRLDIVHSTLQVPTLASGLYFYQVSDQAGNLIQTGKMAVE